MSASSPIEIDDSSSDDSFEFRNRNYYRPRFEVNEYGPVTVAITNDLLNKYADTVVTVAVTETGLRRYEAASENLSRMCISASGQNRSFKGLDLPGDFVPRLPKSCLLECLRRATCIRFRSFPCPDLITLLHWDCTSEFFDPEAFIPPSEMRSAEIRTTIECVTLDVQQLSVGNSAAHLLCDALIPGTPLLRRLEINATVHPSEYEDQQKGQSSEAGDMEAGEEPSVMGAQALGGETSSIGTEDLVGPAQNDAWRHCMLGDMATWSPEDWLRTGVGTLLNAPDRAGNALIFSEVLGALQDHALNWPATNLDSAQSPAAWEDGGSDFAEVTDCTLQELTLSFHLDVKDTSDVEDPSDADDADDGLDVNGAIEHPLKPCDAVRIPQPLPALTSFVRLRRLELLNLKGDGALGDLSSLACLRVFRAPLLQDVPPLPPSIRMVEVAAASLQGLRHLVASPRLDKLRMSPRNALDFVPDVSTKDTLLLWLTPEDLRGDAAAAETAAVLQAALSKLLQCHFFRPRTRRRGHIVEEDSPCYLCQRGSPPELLPGHVAEALAEYADPAKGARTDLVLFRLAPEPGALERLFGGAPENTLLDCRYLEDYRITPPDDMSSDASDSGSEDSGSEDSGSGGGSNESHMFHSRTVTTPAGDVYRLTTAYDESVVHMQSFKVVKAEGGIARMRLAL